MYIQSYKELVVWQKSIELVRQVYKVTDAFPKSEMYGLMSQMRRCAVSIPSNIAEGYKRRSVKEYLQFLSVADASAAELETQIILSASLYPHVDFKRAESLLLEVQKMLSVMMRKLETPKLSRKE